MSTVGESWGSEGVDEDDEETMDAKAFVAADAFVATEGANVGVGWDADVLAKEKGEDAGTAGVSLGAAGG